MSPTHQFISEVTIRKMSPCTAIILYLTFSLSVTWSVRASTLAKNNKTAAQIIFEKEYKDVQSFVIPDGKFGGVGKQTGGIFQFGYHPCRCATGVCSCCTGILLDVIKTNGCMNLTYMPDDFAFELKMMINDRVLYKNTVTGRNPPPICVRLPRLRFIQLCTTFTNVYFRGRNLHLCAEMNADWEGFDLFHRSFDCVMIGDSGFHTLKPEDGGVPPGTGGTVVGGPDSEVDQGGDDEEEDYDENVVRNYIAMSSLL